MFLFKNNEQDNLKLKEFNGGKRNLSGIIHNKIKSVTAREVTYAVKTKKDKRFGLMMYSTGAVRKRE